MAGVALEGPAARLQEAATVLESLAAADLAPAVFFERLVAEVCRAAGCAGGAAWIADRGRFGMMASAGAVTPELFGDAGRVGRNERLLAEAVRASKPLHRPATGVVADAEATVVVPFFPGDGAAGALQFFVQGEGFDPEEAEFAAAVAGVVAAVASYFDRAAEGAKAADPETAFGAYRELCRRAHGSLVPAEVASAVANEGRRLLRCDRVWVLLRRGNRYVATAVSGQGEVSRRSDEVRLAEALAGLAASTEGRFAFDGTEERVEVEAARPLTEYVERSGVRLLWADPLRAAGASGTGASGKRPPVGMVFYEQFGESRAKPALARWADAVTEQAGTAVANAVRHDAIPFAGLLRGVGAGLASWKGRRGVIAGGVVVGLSGLIYAGAVVTLEDRVEARGRLTPELRRGVFAPAEGEVAEVFVRGGGVEAGTPLVRLESDWLSGRLLSAQGRLAEQRQALEGVRASLHAVTGRDAQLRTQAERARLEIEIRGLEEEVKLLEGQMAELTVVAPIGGTVLDPRPEQDLPGRPVRRGEALVEIADETGPWRVELAVPERGAGRVAEALAGREVAIDYRLDAEPAVVHAARLTELATRVTEDPVEGASIAGVGLPAGEVPAGRRVDAVLSARVRCGRRSVLGVLFGDAYDTIRRELWY